MSMILSGDYGIQASSWTTATRPTNPIVGQVGYNTTTGLFDQYTASGWSSIVNSPGTVIQTVNNIINPGQLSSSQNLVTVSITPKFSTSKILVFAGVTAERNGGTTSNYIWCSLQRGAGSVNVAAQFGNAVCYQMTTNARASFSTSVLDNPATTSPITYAIYADYTNASAVPYVWYMCYITALEIAQ